MNELITVSIETGNVSRLSDFPLDLANGFEREMLRWVAEYKRRFDRPPSMSRLRARFPHFVPVETEDDTPPLEDLYEMTVQRKLSTFVIAQLEEARAFAKTEGKVPNDILRNILVTANMTTSVARYSTFDRSLYFREAGIPLGFRLIDRATGGLAKGDYGLITGRLGTGKSTVAMWIAYGWWLQGKKVLYISNEMLATDVFSRVDGMSGNFNPLMLRTSEPSSMKTILNTVAKRAGEGKGEIIVPTMRLPTPAAVASMAQNLDIDVIIIDGVYLMMPDGGGFSSKWERVAAVSNALKQVAMDIRLPMLGITQLKRTGEKETYDPEDLAYSDALGQDADFIMALKQSKILRTRTEIQLIKNRYGPEMATIINTDFDSMTIRDVSVEGDVESEEHAEALAADGSRLW